MLCLSIYFFAGAPSDDLRRYGALADALFNEAGELQKLRLSDEAEKKYIRALSVAEQELSLLSAKGQSREHSDSSDAIRESKMRVGRCNYGIGSLFLQKWEDGGKLEKELFDKALEKIGIDLSISREVHDLVGEATTLSSCGDAYFRACRFK